MVKTRFAPSPTGFLHIGGLRTALYNFLYARKHHGKFLLRIEDTDQKRAVSGAIESLLETLKWAGLTFDEGPFIQSERLHIYKEYAQKLLDLGAAYRCFCTAERLEEMRRVQEAHKLAPKYDGMCRNLTASEKEKKLAEKIPSVIRQKIPDAGEISWKDLVRGDVTFQCETLDDQILLKSDGYPTYHLANIVDDHLMEITHVIRGEEWLSSTPKHIFLYRAFSWRVPEFAHVALLLNRDRTKLSKRQGHVAAEEYRKEGYLPEAMLNFIALLGWHPGGDETREIFSLDELVEKFSLEKVHKGGAVFDIEKLNWINWQWRKRHFEADPREKSEKLFALTETFLPTEWKADRKFLGRCLVTIEEKALQTPSAAQQYIAFYFQNAVQTPLELICNPKMKVDADIAKQSLDAAAEALETCEKFDHQETLKNCLTAVVQKLGFKNGQVLWPTRVALTGEQYSPGVFEVLWALGKTKSLERLKAARQRLE